MDISYYKKMEPFWGNWYIDEELGSGSYGKVFKIKRDDYGETYYAALKVISIPHEKNEVDSLKSEGLDDASISKYFDTFVGELVKEFSLMAKLKGNSNIVSYEDHMTIKHDDGVGCDILIRMELLTPLTSYLKETPLSEQLVAKLGIDICSALEVCEKYNIIHRDIKPENVFVSQLGQYKLGDFGVSRVAENATQGMSLKGTVSFMAPEVFKGLPYNSTVDIYSLGMMLYKLCNNNRGPFLPPVPEIIKFADRENAENLRMNGTELPDAVNGSQGMMAIIRKAAAFDYNERYESASEMKADLEALLAGNFVAVSDKKEKSVKTNTKAKKAKEKAPEKEPSVKLDPANAEVDSTVYVGSDSLKAKLADNKVAGEDKAAGKKKKIIIGAVAAAVVILLAILGASLGSSKTPDSVPNGSTVVNSSGAGENSGDSVNVGEAGAYPQGYIFDKTFPGDAATVEYSDYIYDCTFKLDDAVYALPCDFTRFLDNGWAIITSGITNDTVVEPGKNTQITLKKKSQSISIYCYSATGEVCTVGSSKVGHIDIDKADTVFSFGPDIKIGDSMDKAFDAFGAPSHASGKTAEYTYDSRIIKVTGDGSGVISKVTIENKEYYEVVENSFMYPLYFETEGHTVQIPCKASDLFDDGWIIFSTSVSEDTVISGREDTTLNIGINGYTVSMGIYNPSLSARSISDCVVYAAYFDDLSNASVLGVTGDIDSKELKATFGYLPDKDSVGYYTYYADTMHTKKLEFRKDGGKMKARIIGSKMPEYERPSTNVTRPEYLDKYEPNPSDSASFILDSEVYTLPMPFSELTDKGWTLYEQKGQVPGASSSSAIIEKDGVQVKIQLTNYELDTMPAECCAITEIRVTTDTDIDFSVLDDIQIGTGMDEFTKKTGDMFRLISGDLYSYYEGSNKSIAIQCNEETGVRSIDVKNTVWEY